MKTEKELRQELRYYKEIARAFKDFQPDQYLASTIMARVKIYGA